MKNFIYIVIIIASRKSVLRRYPPGFGATVVGSFAPGAHGIQRKRQGSKRTAGRSNDEVPEPAPGGWMGAEDPRSASRTAEASAALLTEEATVSSHASHILP